MQPHQVARAVEAVRGELTRVVLWHAVVAAQRIRPAAGELADFARRHVAAFVVYQPHFVIRADRPAAGLELHLLRIVEAHEEKHALRHAEVLLHEAARDQLVRAQPHLRLHALAAALDDLHRRQIVLADRGIVDQADEEGRHDLDVRNAMLLDQPEHVLRPRGGREHDFAALEEIALDAGAGERQVVRDGQREQQHRILRHAAHRRSGLRVVGVVVVRARYQLRDAGRAAGELEDARIGRRDADGGEPRLGQRRRPLEQFLQQGQRDAVPEGAALGTDALDHRLELEIPLALRVDAGAGAGELHELADFRVAMRHQRGDRDGADLLQREVEQHEFGDVGQRRHHAVERLEPQLEEVQRQVVGDAVQVGVGELALAVDQRDAVRVFAEHRGEFLRERLVLPIALGAIARGEFGREGHYTGKRHAFSRK